MTIFKNIFGSGGQNKPVAKINWILLKDINQLDEIETGSMEKPAVIFKHSTRCGISRMTLKQFENEFDLEGKVNAYFLDLLEYRNISNEVANRYNVYHQSPQLLLIKNGKSVYDASHGDIDAGELEKRI